MKMLVTKLSKGKYANEGQLFAEVISDDNVKLMGEMIALQALRNVLPYDFEVVSKLYNGLIKDLNHISHIDYTITDGYDYAQTAICFCVIFVFICKTVARVGNIFLVVSEIYLAVVCNFPSEVE